MYRSTRLLILVAVLAAAIVVPFLVLGREPVLLDEAERTSRGGRFIRLSDGYTHADVAGPDSAATATIFVHGTTIPSFIWEPNFRVLSDSGHRVIRYDLYGRGHSDRPSVRYDLQLFVRQLGELVDSLAPAEKLNLVGASIGSMVIAEYARQHPDRIASLVFVDPAGVGTDLPLAARLALAPGLGEYIMRVTGARQLRPGRRMLAHPERYPQIDSQYLATLSIRGSRRAILSTLRSVPFNGYESGYLAARALGKPTLLIWGTEDVIVPFEASDSVRSLIQPTRFHPVADAGHFPNFEAPDEVNAVLLEFLAGS